MNPEALVQGQLEAYNARDVDRFMSYYAADVVVKSLAKDATVLQGFDVMRARYADVFRDSPNLHATAMTRLVQGDFVIDHEHVTGRAGLPETKVFAIYKITGEKISHVWFSL